MRRRVCDMKSALDHKKSAPIVNAGLLAPEFHCSDALRMACNVAHVCLASLDWHQSNLLKTFKNHLRGKGSGTAKQLRLRVSDRRRWAPVVEGQERRVVLSFGLRASAYEAKLNVRLALKIHLRCAWRSRHTPHRRQGTSYLYALGEHPGGVGSCISSDHTLRVRRAINETIIEASCRKFL